MSCICIQKVSCRFITVRVSSNSILYVPGASGEQFINSDILKSSTQTKGSVSLRTQVCLCNQYEAQEVVAFLEKEGKFIAKYILYSSNLHKNILTMCL